MSYNAFGPSCKGLDRTRKNLPFTVGKKNAKIAFVNISDDHAFTKFSVLDTLT